MKAWLGAGLRWLDQRAARWASWQHPVWLLGVLVLILALALAPNPPHPAPQAQVVAPVTARAGTPMDPDIIAILTKARAEAVAQGRKSAVQLARKLNKRVESAFLPQYLSFGRRKFEEIRAYNAFAWSRLKGLFGAAPQDDSVPLLVASFDQDFDQLVLTPDETRTALRHLAGDLAYHYSRLVMVGIQELRISRGQSFPEWLDYLEQMAPGRLVLGSKPVPVAVADLAAPDPLRNLLGDAITQELTARFDQFPPFSTHKESLRMADGRTIFDVGSNAGGYYGSYVVYWIILGFLIRSGLIPLNLSGALLGWLIWETFVWGTWIAYESLGFEQTKAVLEPVILQQADIYFERLRGLWTDPGAQGPYKVLWNLEQAWLVQ